MCPLLYTNTSYVEHFNKKKSKIHTEICGDTNNFINLEIEIDDNVYILKRYINSNEIFVTDNGVIKSYPINRKDKKQNIFSDWILNKLNIEPVEIYNGKYSGIISFEELFRLIHYEQKSNPAKIYKEAKVDGNFVSDSIIRRKAIFEILMGKRLINFYVALNNYKEKEKKYQLEKGVYDSFIKTIEELYNDNILEGESSREKINDIKIKIDEVQNRIELIKQTEYTNEEFLDELAELKDQIVGITFKLEKKKEYYKKITLELEKINMLIENKEIEIKQLKKIVFTHKELNLFSPNTCPYCFNEVNREKDHCVCGNVIKEEYFEKYFYDMNEYLSMIKQKNKSLSTFYDARRSILDDIKECTEEISELRIKLKNNQKLILSLKSDNVVKYNTTGIQRLSGELVELNSQLNLVTERESLYNKGKNLQHKMNEAKKEFDSAKKNLEKEEKSIEININDMISDFSTIYNEFMTEVVENCKNARIDEDYMPIINNGTYINASVDVQTKLVYFITLLAMSIQNEVKFPRLLIIDTPESLGIDKENLINTIKLLSKLSRTKKYQIILTTGIGKYPNSEAFVVKEYLTREKELLKKRE